MKKYIRVFGILLLIGGLILALIGFSQKGDETPPTYHNGILVDGNFIETDSGYMQEEKHRAKYEYYDAMSYFGIGILSIGLIMLISSAFTSNEEKKENEYDY